MEYQVEDLGTSKHIALEVYLKNFSHLGIAYLYSKYLEKFRESSQTTNEEIFQQPLIHC